MEQPADSLESSRPDGAEPSTSRALASEHKEEKRSDSNVLLDAVNRGEIASLNEIIQSMKTNGVGINRQDCYAWTALMKACSEGLTEVALELLKADGNVNVQDRRGWTALIWACSEGLIEVALELLKVDGVDINIQDRGG